MMNLFLFLYDYLLFISLYVFKLISKYEQI